VIVWMLSLPALMVLLTLLAIADRILLWPGQASILPWRRKPGARRASATGFEVLHAHLSAGKA
jgi:hypothetical protein